MKDKAKGLSRNKGMTVEQPVIAIIAITHRSGQCQLDVEGVTTEEG
jgi:hypothetical protein